MIATCEQDINGLKEVGRIVRFALDESEKMVKVTTLREHSEDKIVGKALKAQSMVII